MERLPDELTFDILGRLGPKGLGKARTICSNWNRVGTDEQLWRLEVEKVITLTSEEKSLAGWEGRVKHLLDPQRFKQISLFTYGADSRLERLEFWQPVVSLLRTMALTTLGFAVMTAAQTLMAMGYGQLFSTGRLAEGLISGGQRGTFLLSRLSGVLFALTYTYDTLRSWRGSTMLTNEALASMSLREILAVDPDLSQSVARGLLPKRQLEKALFLKDQPDSIERELEFRFIKHRQ